MTPSQYRAALAKLGLTGPELARLLGVDEATCWRWSRHGVSGTAAILLRLLASGKLTLADVKAAAR